MKGLLLLQRRFAYLGHAVAQNLNETYGLDDFCGYVYQRSSYDFLKTQKDVNYSTLLLDDAVHERYKNEKIDPEYLAYLEKEFGMPFLWPILAVDRILMSNQLIREYPYDAPKYSHEDMLRILQAHARTIIELFEKERPDFVFGSVVGAVGNYLVYQIAKKYGIKVQLILPTCNRHRYILSERYDTFTTVDDRFRGERGQLRQTPAWTQATAHLAEFRAKPLPYHKEANPERQSVNRLRQLKFLNPLNAARSLIVFSRSVVDHYAHPEQQKDYSYIGPWNYAKDLFARKLRNIRGVEDLYDAFDPNEDFAFFPLHYEPEIALLLQAPYYTDQVNLIRQIARSLPVHFKLVVKEHPQMVEYRPRAYYEALKKIPNVKLVNPAISSYAITPNAKLITTITGTVGWEAVIFKKPVISFGHQFYNSLSMVTYCDKIESLPSLVKEKLERHHHDEEELTAFFAVLFEDSIEIDLQRLWTEEGDQAKKKEGLKPLADLLAKKLGLRAR